MNVIFDLYQKGKDARMIGYRPVLGNASPASGANQYELVEIQEVCDFSATSRLITRIHGPFYATGPDAIPNAAKEKEANHVSYLLSHGYTHQGKVTVNAATQEVEALEVDDLGASGAALDWLLTPPTDKEAQALLRGFVAGVFAQGAERLGFEIGESDPVRSLLPNPLMRIPGQFELTAEFGAVENALDPVTLEGAGEIRPEHGHKPLLMLIYLQQRMAEEMNTAWHEGVEFCDTHGEPFKYERFESLEPLIELFEFDYDTVRKDAERLGLVAPIVRFAEIDSESEDCFF